MELKNILVPIDFSDCAYNALIYAIELAQMSKAKLTLLNCYVVLAPVVEYVIESQTTLTITYQKNSEANFRQLIARAGNLGKVAHEEMIKVCNVEDGIRDTAKAIQADLIIMGTKGTSNRVDAFFGSNTYATIKKSEVPVLAIPEKARFKPFQKLLFAADFERTAGIDDLAIIKIIMGLFTSKLDILHVGHNWSDLSMHHSKEVASVVAYFHNTAHSYHFIKGEEDVEEAIDEHLEAHHNDLLILIPRKHHYPGALFRKKVTKKRVMHSELPLLIMSNLR